MSRKDLELSGTYFELQVTNYLKERFPECEIVNDLEVYCPWLEQDTQIDLIYISNKIVVSIEAKNWTDWIKGDCNDVKWTGKSRGKNVMTVFNPVNQNKIHIRALRNAIRKLGAEPPCFHNLVCVPSGTSVYSDCKEVCTMSSLVEKIKKYERYSMDHINKNAMKFICEKFTIKG